MDVISQHRHQSRRRAARLRLPLLVGAFALLLGPVTSAPGQDRDMLNRLVQATGNSDAAVRAFREGQELITDEKWERAARRFKSFIDEYPADKNADAAYYWLAYAYTKQKKVREADEALARLISDYPRSSWAGEGKKLKLQIAGDVKLLEAQLIENKEVELKVIALQGICQADAGRCVALINDILRQPQTNVRLREASVTLLGRHGGAQAVPGLIQLVRGERDEKLRMRAIAALGRTNDERALDVLREQAMRPDFKEESPADSAIHALTGHESPRAVAILGEVIRNSQSLEARKHAIYLLATQRRGEPVVDELMRLYDSDPNLEIKKAAVSGLGHRASPRAKEKLADIARRADNVELRRLAIGALGHGSKEQHLDLLLQMYDAERDQKLKDEILGAIARSSQPSALQKLMQVARNPSESVERRKSAVMWLSRSKDPAVLKFLEEMVR